MRQVVRVAVLAVAVLGIGGAVAETDQAAFYRAYYLEHAENQIGEAEQIYARLVREGDGKIRRAARERRDALREERLGSDLARIMPPNALAYIELNQPGAQLEQLLGQLGLMAEEGMQREPGQLAISPSIIRTIAGLRGAAVAVTGFDPSKEAPAGVLVLHPGDLEVVRGLLETALPVAAEPAGEIEGFTTYSIEDEVYITLTRKLVIVSPQEHEIAGVIERLADSDMENLADSPHMQPLLERRKGGLLYFAVNFEPIMPLMEMAMNAGAGASEEVAIIKELFDPQSLRSLVGEAGVSDNGLFVDLMLDLDDEHRNLVFNFLQLPPLDRETLERIPAGSAAFFAAALNPRHSGTSQRPEINQELPVSGMDIGREVFGNIIGLAAFVLPPNGDRRDSEIPDAGLILTVNDPARSHALWSTMLGVASLAANEGRADRSTVTINGLRVQRYGIEEVELFLATTGTDLILSPSRAAIEQALATRKGKRNLLNDRAYAGVVQDLSGDTTIALGVHPARCLAVASQFMDERDLEEVAPIREMLTDTVASVAITHGRDSFHLAARVANLPNVGGLVSQLIAEQRNGHRHADRRIYRSTDAEMPAAYAEHVERAREHVEQLSHDVVREEAVNPNDLNNRAWALLTEGEPDKEDIMIARELSRQCNELTGFDNWAYLDTLALAEFLAGNREKAIDLQRKAVERAGNDRNRAEAIKSLKRFEKAMAERN